MECLSLNAHLAVWHILLKGDAIITGSCVTRKSFLLILWKMGSWAGDHQLVMPEEIKDEKKDKIMFLCEVDFGKALSEAEGRERQRDTIESFFSTLCKNGHIYDGYAIGESNGLAGICRTHLPWFLSWEVLLEVGIATTSGGWRGIWIKTGMEGSDKMREKKICLMEVGGANHALGRRPGLRIAPVRIKGAARWTQENWLVIKMKNGWPQRGRIVWRIYKFKWLGNSEWIQEIRKPLKAPLADFIEELYFKRFRKEKPDTIRKMTWSFAALSVWEILKPPTPV